MNEKLHFSWGHIVAFVALIAVTYFSFMGFTYLSDGNFTIAIVGAALTFVIFIGVFIGAQFMKSSGEKISRKIIWERILIFGSPFVFVACMIPVSHFWTVQSRNDEVSKKFVNSLNDSRQLFSDYDTYSLNRIAAYGNMLDAIISNQETDPATYTKAGFEAGKEKIQRDNMVQTLHLMLLSDNYRGLKEQAIAWIDKGNEGASTWNIFLLGNKRQISHALENWEKILADMSSPVLSNETLSGPVAPFSSNGAKAGLAGIDSLTNSFTTGGVPTIQAIVFGIVVYLMLLLPYFIQQRHGRQVARNYSLWKGSAKAGISIKEKTKESFPHDTIARGNTDDAAPSENKGSRFKRITLD